MARVLVLGGVSSVGRALVKYLVDNKLASKVRVVDKVLPQTSHLSEEHQKAFADPIVEYKQGNLSNAGSIEKCFTDESGEFQVVFNLAGESKLSQSEEVYKEKVLDVSVKCATEAAKRKVEKFVELSTCHVYESSDKVSDENAKLAPWTTYAKYKLQAEEALRKIDGLNLIIIRAANIYGCGETQGVMPRFVVGAVYTRLGETQKLLWDKGMKLNTVHAIDVARAMWHVSQNGKLGEVYNVVDKSKSDQGSINKLLEAIFGIKTGFLNAMMCQGAKVNMKLTTEVTNEKHLQPWSDLCKDHKIANTPLTPYLDQELLYNKDLSVDGSKIESTGFQYEVPEITVERAKEAIEYFTKQQLFPAI